MMRNNESQSDNQPIRIKLKGKPKGPDDAPTKAQRWVSKIYSTLPKNPLNSEQVAIVFGEGEDQQLALFEIRPSASEPDAAYINWFQAYPQRQGVGTKAMRRMQELAAEDGIKLILNAWTKGKVPERVLKRFYGNMGFQSGKSREGMIWEPIKEDQSNKDITELFKNVAESFRDKQPYDALEWVEDSGIDINTVPALKKLFDANMHQFAKMVADDVRHGESDGHVFVRIRDMMEGVGIDMPNGALRDALYDQSHLIDRGLLRMIENGAYSDAITVMAELSHWGLNITIDDIIDPDEAKDDILRSMLLDMKKGHTSAVSQLIQALEDIGISWPEFDAFSKSLAAGGKITEASWSKYDPETYDDSEDPSYAHNKRHATSIPASAWNKSKYNDPDVDLVDDGIRAPSVTKIIPEIGTFIFSGHFRDRMRQRKVEPIDAFNLVAHTFKKHHKFIQDLPESDFICLDPSGLGIIVTKEFNRDGPEYTLVTVHPRLYIAKKKKYMPVLREDGVLDKPTPSIDDLAIKYKVPVQDVLIELKKGVEVELEHTTQLHVAREIAMDHLSEDLYYYVKLAKAEAGDQSKVGLDENGDEHDQYLDELMIHLKSYLLDRRYDQSIELIQEICYMDNVPDRLKELLDRNKNGLLRRLLEFIKYSTMGNYLTPSLAGFDAETVVSGLRKLGVDWPELDAIGKSVKRR